MKPHRQTRKPTGFQEIRQAHDFTRSPPALDTLPKRG
jgi:hypothetical protein